jgi:hypothetical protein
MEINAVKRVIALQMQESLKREHLTKTELAAQLETCRAAIKIGERYAVPI